MDALTQWLAAQGISLPGPSVPWEDPLLLVHLLAGGLAVLAGLAIPFGITRLLRRHTNLDHRYLWPFLAALALSGGLLQATLAWELWEAQPWRLAIAKALAAGFALATALALWRAAQRGKPARDTGGLREANRRLNRELRERQQSLQLLESRFGLLEEIFNQAGWGLALLSPAKHWLKLNPRLAELLGQDRAELLRSAPQALLPEPLLTQGETVEQEWALSDGHRRWLRFSPHWLSSEGKELGLLIQCEDLSGQRQLEQSLERTRRELEALLAEQARTQNDTAARLEQALTEKLRLETETRRYTEQLGQSNRRLDGITEQLGRVVRFDPDTGLLSRHQLLIELVRAVAAAHRYGMPLALLLVVPEPGGHSPSEAFSAVAAVLNQVVRETDAAGRYDEQGFALLLPQADENAAHSVAQKLRLAIAAQQQDCEDGISCSVGVAIWQRGTSAAKLLYQAGCALNRARGSSEEGMPMSGEP